MFQYSLSVEQSRKIQNNIDENCSTAKTIVIPRDDNSNYYVQYIEN